MLLVERLTGELVTRLTSELAEAVVIELVQRRADDPARGDHAGLYQPQQAGEQLASGKITGGAEQHDHVRFERRHQRRGDAVRIMALTHGGDLRARRLDLEHRGTERRADGGAAVG